ncbi:MAG: hypothetical protein OXJ90_17400, partial [Spirochaetaceae bacterium]|nr:hypothetical protein [Spirochaetaceae bacterium]
MHLMAAVVENLVKPAVLRGLLAWERRESGVAYDFISEEVKTDPYRGNCAVGVSVGRFGSEGR